MTIEIIENDKTGALEVFIDNKNFGIIDEIDGAYCYFPKRNDQLSGDNYISIGIELNKLNNTKENVDSFHNTELDSASQISKGVVSLFYQIESEGDFIKAVSNEVPSDHLASLIWHSLNDVLESE
jgi:hypothetical protein